MPQYAYFSSAVAASLMMLAAGCGTSAGHPSTEQTILTVSALPVRRASSFEYPIIYYGRVEPTRQAALSFELAGRLVEVMIDEGDTIAEGDPVARLDTASLEAEKQVLVAQRGAEASLLDRLRRGEREEVIAAATADVRRLEVEEQLSRAERDRAENVYAARAISKADYDKALSAHAAATYSLEQARQRLEELESGTRAEDIQAQESRVATIDARLKQLQVRFDKSVLTAPFDGVCIRRFQDEGETLSPGQTVVEINEAGRVQARFSIPQPNLGLVRAAQHLRIDGQQYSVAEARAISRVDEMTRTVDVVVPLKSNANKRVLPGQTCTLVITQRVEADCVELPISALVPSIRGLWSCYRLSPDQGDTFTVEKVDVTIIHTDGSRAFVSSSLPEQSLIVSDGVHKVVPGVRVRTSGIVP